ncbi:ubiquinol--cytochrome-c reductase subunit 9 ASCRUDRAFT_14741 [Ascoidea rubescens DSM 1968]|uniref:Complex III subunit 9 n=1 Tax=Ascoidea rubescens DSM 1968 TaxID=1344418 RepID=A0A1D2VE24_9ASCO|nr:hypothetical protein ASCRUDRAFT_14741 [Ascoidea rubescens DSM 1968]ODV59717.1 hypothetical protein ASCRUDRAFT_14741 [Ascoidea rubescens DSM 1968]
MTSRTSEFSFYTKIYNSIFKRNSTFVATVFAGTFIFQASFDSAITRWYENHNKGKLWKDIKPAILARNGGGDEDADEDDDE